MVLIRSRTHPSLAQAVPRRTPRTRTRRPRPAARPAEAFRRKLAEGETLDALNAANHLALDLKTITMEHFKAAAEILKAEILKR